MSNLSTKPPATLLTKDSNPGDFVTWVSPTDVRYSGHLKKWVEENSTDVAVITMEDGKERRVDVK